VTRPRMTIAAAVALFLRWLAVGHVTATIGRTPVTVPALAVAGAVAALTALAVAAVAVCTARAAAIPPPSTDPDAARTGRSTT
jgi:hypothetical protein